MPKTVLITGGSSGVGAELVSLFAERGYTVWFTYNSGRQRADKLLETLPKDCKAQVKLCSLLVWATQIAPAFWLDCFQPHTQ